MVFRGYIDESYSDKSNVFALSCIIANGKYWLAMERAWKLNLAAKNRELKKAKRPPISRYHATDCSGRRLEFEGWSHDERDAFVRGLFQIFKRIPVHVVAITLNLDELTEVFPQCSANRLKCAYSLLTRFVMATVAQDFDKLSNGKARENGDKITLFHDRTTGYDATILEAFNVHISTPSNHGAYFTTIAPLGWEDCVALQPADLVAFEVFKEEEAREASRKSRKSFKALLDLEAFGIHTRLFNKDCMYQYRELLEAKLAKESTP